MYIHNKYVHINKYCQYQNKRPMGHIAHLRKQFKSINTYDYIITMIKRRKKNIIILMRIKWFFFEQIWIPFTQGCFVPSLIEIAPVVLERKIFKILSMYFHYFVINSPWKRVPLRDEIHNLRNFYEPFMNIHDIFMTGSWLVHQDISWILFMNIFIKCDSWTNDEYIWILVFQFLKTIN